MNPGRELDALIAEKVMGWRISADGPNGEMGCTDENQCERHRYDVPTYSTSIAAAWEVVGRLGELGYKFYLYESEVVVPGWEVELTYGKGNVQGVHAATAPLAICLAALKTV